MRQNTGLPSALSLRETAISHPVAKSIHLTSMPASKVDAPVQDAKSGPMDSARTEFDSTLLDNPIWNSLLTDHASLALGTGPARRYPAEIGPLSGTQDQSIASYEALRQLAGPGGVVGLFLRQPRAMPAGWTLIRGGLVDQMIWATSNNSDLIQRSPDAPLRALTIRDVPQMVALAELTEPGPFRTRTIELGNFYGIFQEDRLLAMAGQRMRVPGFIEVSAVCTHPDARGRGYARVLMSQVMRDIQVSGRTPFLHVLADNNSAIRLYQSLGFTRSRTFHLAVLKNDR
jgi:ribosomal protein S18 acetylase RimI-like enzyme